MFFLITKTANSFLTGVSNAAKKYYGILKGDLTAINKTQLAPKLKDIKRELNKSDRTTPNINRVMQRAQKNEEFLSGVKNPNQDVLTKLEKAKKLREKGQELLSKNKDRIDKLEESAAPIRHQMLGNKTITYGTRGITAAIPGIPMYNYAKSKYDAYMEPKI